MNLEQVVLEKLRALPPDKQQEIRDFADFIHKKNMPKKPLKSTKALYADLKVDITEEDIVQARRKMWGNFLREIV